MVQALNLRPMDFEIGPMSWSARRDCSQDRAYGPAFELLSNAKSACGAKPNSPSAYLLNPELAPTSRTYVAVDQGAGIRFFEQRAVAALLITLW
jgi:hypothetical protein